MSLKKLTQIEFSPNQKLNYPILGLLVATFVLLLVVGFLTYLNYNREEGLLKDHLKRQGITVIRALEAATRSGMMDMMWGENQIQSLFIETAKGPNIDRILLVDKNGKVITDSEPASTYWHEKKLLLPEYPKETLTLIYEKEPHLNIFRVIRTYEPIANNQNRECWMHSCCNESVENTSRYLVLDLKMQEFQAAQDEDVRLAIFYGLILFIIGSAALYFLLLAQNYYVASRTLKTMEGYTRNVVESMPNGLISLDKEQCIETINRNAILLLKLDGSQIIGRPLSEVLSNCLMPETFLPGENIYQKQVECHLNDGSTIPLSTTLSQLRDETGQVIGSVIMLRDLREIRSLEKQVQRSERLASLGRMAAGIAHEIRNPLGSIKGFAQYFRNKFTTGSEDRNYATVMVNEVDRLNRVIQDLLNFAKPQEPKLERVDLQSIIRHSLNLVLPELRSKNIKTVENIVSGPSVIIADADMITQVFLNLFLNAIEAIERDGELGISLTEKNAQYEISVKDSGGGITEENLPHIFDPFFTLKKDGTGLGLAVVYRIIENHNGTIEVESKIPLGTSFHLVFWKVGHMKTGALNET